MEGPWKLMPVGFPPVLLTRLKEYLSQSYPPLLPFPLLRGCAQIIFLTFVFRVMLPFVVLMGFLVLVVGFSFVLGNFTMVLGFACWLVLALVCCCLKILFSRSSSSSPRDPAGGCVRSRSWSVVGPTNRTAI